MEPCRPRDELGGGLGFIVRLMGSLNMVGVFFVFLNLLIIEREGRERERNTDMFLHLLMHSLVGTCMCPDGRFNH